jgi:proliferating cell nuclear antigen
MSSGAAGDQNNILELKTVQSSTFKQVIDALKEILMDVNLEFDETGMKIMAMDTGHVVLVFLKLEADKFEKYVCKNTKHVVGLNMLRLYTIIKTLSTNDILTFFIEENDINNFGIKIENIEKNFKTTYKLSMLDIDSLNVNIPPIDFHTTISMPSSYFQKMIRDMHNIAEYLEIRNVEDQLFLNCKGEFCTQETVLGTEKSNNIHIVKNEEKVQEIIQGVYSLKYLSIFTKCTNLCNIVEIYLKNSYPIILKYNIANIGSIQLCLSQSDVV